MSANGLTIRGLSLTRPWPFAFVCKPITDIAPKLIENRTWKPPRALIGHFLALHAAKSWDETDRRFIRNVTGLEVPPKSEFEHSKIFAVCRLTGWIENEDDPRLQPDQRDWFFGPYGWLLSDLVALKTTVTCIGGLGLWKFDERPNELKMLREAYREAKDTEGMI